VTVERVKVADVCSRKTTCKKTDLLSDHYRFLLVFCSRRSETRRLRVFVVEVATTQKKTQKWERCSHCSHCSHCSRVYKRKLFHFPAVRVVKMRRSVRQPNGDPDSYLMVRHFGRHSNTTLRIGRVQVGLKVCVLCQQQQRQGQQEEEKRHAS
jgi:hypothetical protein